MLCPAFSIPLTMARLTVVQTATSLQDFRVVEKPKHIVAFRVASNNESRASHICYDLAVIFLPGTSQCPLRFRPNVDCTLHCSSVEFPREFQQQGRCPAMTLLRIVAATTSNLSKFPSKTPMYIQMVSMKSPPCSGSSTDVAALDGDAATSIDESRLLLGHAEGLILVRHLTSFRKDLHSSFNSWFI